MEFYIIINKFNLILYYVKKNRFKKIFLIVVLKRTSLIKTVVKWIFAWKIYEKQVSMNKNQLILVFIKPRFKTWLFANPVQKNKYSLPNQTKIL
jgi:hypothetical protein